MTTVGELGELALLARLHPFLALEGGQVVVGAGDDAAVWQPPLGRAVVVTTDSLAEGVHFTLPLDPARAVDLGWRLLAVSLSDLAAMGARPGPAFISLALPAPWPVAWVEAIYQGLAECAARFEVPIAGGNMTESAAALLTSTCVGSVEPGEALLRRGARAGWDLAVTGSLGAAAAALRAAAAGQDPDPAWRAAARPIPRVEAGQALLDAGIRVAIDVSDGLYADARRLLAPDGPTGLLIEADALPAAAGVRRRWPRDWQAVVGGGEDYELLFAGPHPVMERARQRLAALDLAATVIGRFDGGAGVRVRVAGNETAPPAAGHEHFSA